MNQQGFVTLSMIFALPLLLTLSFTSLMTLWLINQKQSIDNICFKYAVKAQAQLVQGNNGLLKLNPKAKLMILEKKALDAVIAMAPPPVKIAARARRRVLVTQQKALSLKQTAIRQAANWQSRHLVFKLQQKIKSKFSQISQFWNQTSRSQPVITTHWKPSQIVVDLKDIASTYKRSGSHTQKQKLLVYWRFNLQSILPLWLMRWVPTTKIWQGKCSSHPHKGDLQWISTIGEGKH